MTELAGMLPRWRRFRRGVFSHVYLRSRIEGRVRNLATEDREELRHGTSLDHSYNDPRRAEKERFLEFAASGVADEVVWDVGANTGAFSEILARRLATVVAIDSYAGAVGAMYRRLRDAGNERIVPLLMEMADPSPDRGWRGQERRSLPQSGRPVLATWLAVHHICLAGEVPVEGFLDLVVETSPHADRRVRRTRRPDEPPLDGHPEGTAKRLPQGVVHGSGGSAFHD